MDTYFYGYEDLKIKIRNLRNIEEISLITRVLNGNEEIDYDEVVNLVIYESSGPQLCLKIIDSIIKEVGRCYVSRFGRKIACLFKVIFEESNSRERGEMLEMRKTWTGIFQESKLLRLDQKVHCLDNNWPLYVIF